MDAPELVSWRQMVGKRLQEIVWGGEVRGVGGGSANRWANLVRHWVGKGFMPVAGMDQVAHRLRDVLDEEGHRPGVWFSYELDLPVYHRYREALIEEGRTKRWRNVLVPMGGKRGRDARITLSRGRCPVCARDVSVEDVCGHGYGRPKKVDGWWEVDGKKE